MTVPPLPQPESAGRFFEIYTQGLTAAELERVFTSDAVEAYRMFSRQIDRRELRKLPWHRRVLTYTRMSFLGFTLKLTPGRRAMYGLALVLAAVGVAELVTEMAVAPNTLFAGGIVWLLAGFALVNLLVILEVADRLSLKNDLDVARQIQLAMLPRAAYQAPFIDAFGMTRPANTVGGDFYDIIPLPDGRVLLALGDVAGKGSPAALLMALLLAMLRTLVDEGLHGAELVARLNAQIARHAPPSRFVTLFVGLFDPASGDLQYVNAGQNPPLLRRCEGPYERLQTGGMALGLFEHAAYSTGHVAVDPGDVLVMYSDGIPEAEDASARPFEETGLQSVVDARGWTSAKELAWGAFEAVEHHVGARRLFDDLTVLVVRRLPLVPALPVLRADPDVPATPPAA
jgi:serine phosphatase RsbU (regulator of sigma subunit)